MLAMRFARQGVAVMLLEGHADFRREFRGDGIVPSTLEVLEQLGLHDRVRELALHPETRLYLGLIHVTDGVEGATPRIGAVRLSVPEFGAATECGLGRRDAATIPELLQLHAEVTDLVPAEDG